MVTKITVRTFSVEFPMLFEMQPHARLNYSRSFYPEPFVSSRDPHLLNLHVHISL